MESRDLRSRGAVPLSGWARAGPARTRAARQAASRGERHGLADRIIASPREKMTSGRSGLEAEATLCLATLPARSRPRRWCVATSLSATILADFPPLREADFPGLASFAAVWIMLRRKDDRQPKE